MSKLLPHGILVVDKPSGLTSHDVVQFARRGLHTRSVGHAGTLDPMATGVLVLGIGEGTKLLHHLSAHDKSYLATLKLGAETDTLDAEGKVVATASVPAGLCRADVTRAAAAFLGEHLQRAPRVSAIKQQGVPLHTRVRRGEHVEPPERAVRVDELELLDVRSDEIDLRVRSGKGFYVRALARDLAVALGTLGHLTALRRIASGGFTLQDAVGFSVLEQARRGDEAARTELLGRLVPLASALPGSARVTVDALGVEDVRQGRALLPVRVAGGELPADGSEPVAVLDEAGTLIALGRCRAGRVEIARGILAG